MEPKNTINQIYNLQEFSLDEIAKLKKVSEINNQVFSTIDDLVICSAENSCVKEIAELWANLASIQQISHPEKYSFQKEDKNWQAFVRKKLEKKNNLLLVAHDKGKVEVKGFLYLQTITLPSSDLILKGVIEDLYIKPQHRRQDIATKLLDVAMDWAEKQNIKQVELISLTSAKDLSLFYLQVIKNFNRDVNLDLVTF